MRDGPPRLWRVRAPASSANLGPGFDCLAAALSLHLVLQVEEADGFRVSSDSEGLPLDRTNLCVRAFELLHPADGLSFSISSEIPVAAGLGSSAAAIVAGLLAADAVSGGGAPVLEHAARLEGHPDNVAAALLGGIVVCADERAERLEPPAGLEAVVATPPDPVPTALARAALPAQVPLADAVHNAARTALLTLGLARGDLELVARGLADRLHQPHREHLYPRSMELVRRARELGALGASISGAGPSVLFWSRTRDSAAVLDRLAREAPECKLRPLAFTPRGAEVVQAERDAASATAVVRAAGGVLRRRGPDGRLELAVVHRPKYDDWSFPKGKLDPGEGHEDAALREVREETGLLCRLEEPLGTVRYRDRRRRPKEVRYWAMTVVGGEFVPNPEVDELRWLEPAAAGGLLSYAHDAAFARRLEEGARRPPGGGFDPSGAA